MSEYFYTYKNEYDVVDVGCIEAVSDKDYRSKVKGIGIKPLSVYISQEAYLGFEFTFKTPRYKYMYRNTIMNNGCALFSGKKPLSLILLLGLLLLLSLCGAVFLSPYSYLLSLGIFVVLIQVNLYYELEVNGLNRLIIKRKKFLSWIYWQKKIDVSNSKIRLIQKVASRIRGAFSGFEKLYVTQIEFPEKSIAIDSAYDKASEEQFAQTISQILNLPLLSD